MFLWSNIPALAAGKRAFRQLRWVCEPFRAQKQVLIIAKQSKAHEQGLSLIDAPPQKQKRHPNGCRFKDFDALRQYFQTLRLTSELVDLRVGNANLILRHSRRARARTAMRNQNKKRSTLGATSFCWWSIKDFAPLEQYTCTRC